VLVVMGDEAARFGWRDVRVDLCREVQLNLDGVRQRANRAHVPVDVVQDDGVTVGEVVADAGQVETAIGKPVGVRVLLVVAPYQAHRGRRLAPITLQEFFDRRRPVQKTVEVTREASLDVVMRCAPIPCQERSAPQAVAATRLGRTRR
jgi:hypothetical protein